MKSKFDEFLIKNCTEYAMKKQPENQKLIDIFPDTHESWNKCAFEYSEKSKFNDFEKEMKDNMNKTINCFTGAYEKDNEAFLKNLDQCMDDYYKTKKPLI